jgi:hypothetical protein
MSLSAASIKTSRFVAYSPLRGTCVTHYRDSIKLRDPRLRTKIKPSTDEIEDETYERLSGLDHQMKAVASSKYPRDGD